MTSHLAKSKVFDKPRFKHELESTDHPITVFKEALFRGQEALKGYHLEGGNAAEVITLNAWLVDHLLEHSWRRLTLEYDTPRIMALVACGGYGRGELHPASDVDILILLQRSPNKEAKTFIEHFIRFLWDIGLEVGHSVRSIKECISESRNDITVATNLMESRHLQGDPDLTKMMLEKNAPPRIWPVRQFFTAKWEEQIARHLRFHDTAYNLEPNIKEGPGGLRDIHMIGWVTRRYFGSNSLQDLLDHQFLTEEEYRTLIRGRNFLWRIRNGLHFLTGRGEDRLLFDHQKVLAQQMGYEDTQSHLAVEQLMKKYFRTVKELRLLNEILLQHFQEAILSKGRKSPKTINRRFRVVDGFLETRNPNTFSSSPSALLEIFLVLQQHPEIKGIRASTLRQMRANLGLIDANFRKDLGCRTLFMEILRQPNGQTHAFRRMNAYGVLGAYIPVFGNIVGQMQFDLFHVYTVDAHSLFVLRNLRRLSINAHRSELPEASDLMGHIFKKERLYLAGLFHDIGKGRGGDHSVLGEQDAYTFCKQHDLSDYDAHFVSWLVRHHLIMSWTAQRKDIADPEVIFEFAQIVGDQAHLDNLYLLTISDLRGTSPKVWNTWKGRLLAELYAATTRLLSHGLQHPTQLGQRVEEIKKDALSQLDSSETDMTAVIDFWDHIADDYFVRYDADAIAWHAKMIIRTSAVTLPLVTARHTIDVGANQFLICAPDAEDLLLRATSGFDRLRLNIVDARIHTTRTGLSLMTFAVLTQSGEMIEDQSKLDHSTKQLRNQLITSEDYESPRRITLSRAARSFPVPTKVEFSESPGGDHTIMEVEAQDRPGLLKQIALALLQSKFKLDHARITTFGERAEDVFFITDRDNLPIPEGKAREQLVNTIKTRLDLSKYLDSGRLTQ